MINETQEKIVRALKQNKVPMRIKEIAAEINVTGQTVRNHIDKPIKLGLISAYYKPINGAIAYIATNRPVHATMIHWQGDEKMIEDIVIKMAEGEKVKAYYAPIRQLIFKMYALSARALDDDNPQPIKYSELKEIQMTLISTREIIRSQVKAIEDLLDIDDLWDPKELPVQLIMKSEFFTVEKVYDMIEKIGEDGS